MFDRFAGACAILAGLSGLAYSVSFLVLSGAVPAGNVLTALFLLVGALLTTAVFVALYGRLREIDRGFAVWALLLGMLGAGGAAVHGGWDLNIAIRPPDAPLAIPANPADPRGLLTFGVTGIATGVFALLMRRGAGFPRRLADLGALSGVLLVLIYLARLLVFDPNNPLVAGPAALEGLVVNPAFYVWLGLHLRR